MKTIIALLFIILTALPSSAETVVRDWYGCTNKSTYDTMLGYAMNYQDQLFSEYTNAAIVSGECVMLSKGQKIMVVESKAFSGIVKVKMLSTLDEYWTGKDAYMGGF